MLYLAAECRVLDLIFLAYLLLIPLDLVCYDLLSEGFRMLLEDYLREFPLHLGVEGQQAFHRHFGLDRRMIQVRTW